MVHWSEKLLRSLLFAPGDHPRKVAKVATFGADAIVLDLEDAVASNQKDEARRAIRAAVATFRDTTVMVRINGFATGRCVDDLEAIFGPAVDAVVLPKVESTAVLDEVDGHLARLEERYGMARGTVRLFPQIETAMGVARVEEIAFAASARVHTLIFGLADFSVDLGIDLTADAAELLYARSRVVVAARAAQMAPPIDGPYLLDLHDEAGLIRDTRRSRQLGFQGRVAVYPPQVGPINRTFAELAPDELVFARKVVDAFEAAEAAGSASIQVDGRFVDYPIYRRAVHKLRLQQAADAK